MRNGVFLVKAMEKRAERAYLRLWKDHLTGATVTAGLENAVLRPWAVAVGGIIDYPGVGSYFGPLVKQTASVVIDRFLRLVWHHYAYGHDHYASGLPLWLGREVDKPRTALRLAIATPLRVSGLPTVLEALEVMADDAPDSEIGRD